MLLNAFTRALRDGFPPARVAGLKAIVATSRYHSADDAATRVLPAVAPLCVDAVHEVRTSALACVEHFSGVLRKHNAELEKKAAEQAAEAAASGGGAAPGTSGGSSLLTSLGTSSLGWAASSLGLGGGGRSGAADAAAAPKPAAAPTAAADPAAAAVAPAARKAGGATAAAAPAAAPAAGGGWGNDDDLFEDMVDDVAAGDAPQAPAASWHQWERGARRLGPDRNGCHHGCFDLFAQLAAAPQQACCAPGPGPDAPFAPGNAAPCAEREARQRLSKMAVGGSRPAAAATPAPAATRGGDSWGDGDGDGWQAMNAAPAAPAAAPRAARPAGGAAGPRRPLGARPAGGSGTAGGAAARKPSGGGMKLGVAKLGGAAAKLDAEFDNW